MIYFDKLFALKEKYRAALDEDSKARARIEKNFADGWITDACRKYELEKQGAASHPGQTCHFGHLDQGMKVILHGTDQHIHG